MMCKFCEPYYGQDKILFNNRVLSNKTQAYVGVQACVDDNELNILAVADTYEPGVVEAKIKINYCPMCGTKLPVDD